MIISSMGKSFGWIFFAAVFMLSSCSLSLSGDRFDPTEDSGPDLIADNDEFIDDTGMPDGEDFIDVPLEDFNDVPFDVPLDPDIIMDPGPIDPDVTDPSVDEIIPETFTDTSECIPLEGGTCNLISGCNCAAGQACRITLTMECDLVETCATNSGTLSEGSPCTMAYYPEEEPCAPGHICTTPDGYNYNCFKWCTTRFDCPMGYICYAAGSVYITGCGDVELHTGVCATY